MSWPLWARRGRLDEQIEEQASAAAALRASEARTVFDTSATPEAAIDWERFGLIRGVCSEVEGPTSLASLVAIFLEQSARRLDQLRAALAAGDAATLALVAHGMKGSSGTFGAMTAGALAEALEEAGQCGALDEAARLLPHLETELGLVRTALARELERVRT